MDGKISPNLVVEKCQQAGINFWLASKTALDMKDSLSRRMSDDETNRRITEALRRHDGDAAMQFESYHSIHVRTSKNTLDAFDKKRISDSIMKETRLPRVIAEEIADEVEADVRRLQLKNISSPLIREIVNTKLIERKLTTAKVKYTRVGLPVHDITEIIEKQKLPSPYLLNELFGNAMMQEYTLTKILSTKVSEAYLGNDIHIHSLEKFITSPISIQNDLRWFLKHGFLLEDVVRTGPAKKADVAAAHAARALLTSRKYVAGGVGFDFFNIFMAPYLYRKTQKEIKQVAQTFLYEVNRDYRAEHSFSINLDTKIPKYLRNEKAVMFGKETRDTYGDYSDEAESFLKIFLETIITGDYGKRKFLWPNVCVKYTRSAQLDFDMPKPIFMINQDKFENSSLVYGNALSNKNWGDGLRSGIMQTVSVNTLKIASTSNTDNQFFSGIDDCLDLAKEVMEIKKRTIEKRMYEDKMLLFLTQKFGSEEYIRLDNFRYLVSFAGLPEACRTFLKKKSYDSECCKFSQKVFRSAKKKFRAFENEAGLKFSLGESANNEAVNRFSEFNRRTGIDMDSSRAIVPEVSDEDYDLVKDLQQHCDAGAFFSNSNKNLTKDKDFIFLKLV
jgi:anaerobic ribonucleoside-triphosphate reductase